MAIGERRLKVGDTSLTGEMEKRPIEDCSRRCKPLTQTPGKCARRHQASVPDDTRQVCPTTPVVWRCVLIYITSSMDLKNLAATCRSFHELVNTELGWSYLIRAKFGDRLWVRHVRQILHRPSDPRINLHADIETMEKSDVMGECATMPATFLLNKAGVQIMPVTRAIRRSYRYHLETTASKQIVYLAPSPYIVRQYVSFRNIRSEHLSDEQRQTVPLSKLLYFYLADRRQIPVVDFSMIYPRE